MALIRKTITITTDAPESVDALWGEMAAWAAVRKLAMGQIILDVFARVLAGDIEINLRGHVPAGKIRTYQDYQDALSGAKALHQNSASDYLAEAYWGGYRRGLHRYWEGEKFGTERDHQLWLASADEPDDLMRRARGQGYRTGVAGMGIEEAIRERWVEAER